MSNYLSVSSLTKYLKLKFDKDPYLERVYFDRPGLEFSEASQSPVFLSKG